MIHELDDVRHGFETDCDVVVVGSGPGGSVAAANLARAGYRVVIVEAGPHIRADQMSRHAPKFLARYYWDGGLRFIGGKTQVPSLQARCLGGGSVVNSAIMLKLPDWVRDEWREDTGLDLFHSPAFEAAYGRVFERLKVAPTPMTVMGRRNLVMRDAFEAVGHPSGPLPRAVHGCEGCGDCLVGCASGAKQSMNRNYLPSAVEDGAEIFTCAHVDKILTQGTRAVGVIGHVVDPKGRRKLAKFKVNAKKMVVVSAGPVHTPFILQKSKINGNRRVGATFFAHIGSGLVGVMEEPIEPWVGATQGWGAISRDIRGLKYETLWAHPSVLLVRWGDVGDRLLQQLGDIRNTCVIVMVYRAKMKGNVRIGWGGGPSAKLWVQKGEAQPVLRGLKFAGDALLKAGARYVHTGLPGIEDQITTPEKMSSVVESGLSVQHLQTTMTHLFGSCRMSAKDDGAVDPNGKVHGVDNVYVCDGSLFPSPSAVNPQATIMALSDIVSRRLGDLQL